MSYDTIRQIIESLRRFFPPRITVALISMSPVFELRGGVVAARLLHLSAPAAFFLCVTANLLPIPLVILFARPLFRALRRTRLLRRPAMWVRNKTAVHRGKLARYEMLGLFLLTAVPIPGTGAWTAALAAAMFNIPLKRAMAPIAAGTVTIALLMLLVTYALPTYLRTG